MRITLEQLAAEQELRAGEHMTIRPGGEDLIAAPQQSVEELDLSA